jgi:tetratricopeptide (TPR) repeat protein
LRARGDSARARDLFLRALGVARVSTDSLTIARALLSIGDFERSQGMHDDAAQAFDQAIEALHPIDPAAPEIGLAYLSKGGILQDLGDEAGAQRLYLLAHAQYRKAGDRRGEAGAAMALGGLALEERRMEEAQRYLSEAAPVLREVGALPELSDALVKLALVRREAGDLTGSVTAYREALDARARMGDASGAAMIYMNLGSLFEDSGDFANAGMAYHQAREALTAAGDTAAARSATEAVLRMKERGASAPAPPP